MPRVSVVIPTYNCVRFLPGAIRSVLAQTYRDFEVIVVDDGSTGYTDKAVAPFLKKIIYIKQENRGPAVARNCGIAASTGELVAFLDDDDEWMPDKLALQVPLFDDHEVGLAYSDVRVLYDDGRVTESFLATRPLATSGYIFANFLASGFILMGSVIVRRRALDEVGAFDESMKSLEDFELWMRVLRRWKAALVRQPLFLRRMRAGNMTMTFDPGGYWYVRLYEKAIRELCRSRAERRIAEKRMAEVCYARGYWLGNQGRRPEALYYMLRSLWHDAGMLAAWRSLVRTLVPVALRGPAATEAH